MGWYMSGNRPIIYRWAHDSTDVGSIRTESYFTWMTESEWRVYGDVCIKFKNDTGNNIKFGKLAMNACSCDSGGQRFWTSYAYRPVPCIGYPLSFYIQLSVSPSDNSGSAINYSKVYASVPSTNGTNMNYPGSSTSRTAQFGDPPYTNEKALRAFYFDLSTINHVIPSGHFAYLRFGLANYNPNNAIYHCIRFRLNPAEMQIPIESEHGPYIWVYSAAEKKWHLREPLYHMENKSWVDPGK